MYLLYCDSTIILCPNLSHNLLTIYNPIPVELETSRPFSPVNDLLNTLLKSLFLIPIPLSIISKAILLVLITLKIILQLF